MANLSQIEKFLKSKNLKYQIIDLGGDLPAGKAGVYRVKDVVETGAKEDEIVKTLIVRTPNNPNKIRDKIKPARRQDFGKARRSFKNIPFVVLAVRGKDRVDFKKVRRLFGSKSELAKPEEVLKVVGVPVGAVCPILIEVPLYFDRMVMNLVHVNMGCGDLTKGLEMDFEDFEKAVGKYEVRDLT